MRWASGSPVQLGIDGIRNRPIESADHPEGEEARPALDLAATSGEQREAEHEQQVADDGAGQRSADDLGQALVDRDQGDDQLGRVAERGVEEAADSGAGVLGGVLRGLADQPGERDQRGGGENEERGVTEIGEVVERDDDRARGPVPRRGFVEPCGPATLPAT